MESHNSLGHRHHALLAPAANALHASHSLSHLLAFDIPPIPSGNSPIWTLLPPSIETDEEICDLTGVHLRDLQARPVFVTGYQDVDRPNGDGIRVQLRRLHAMSVGRAVLLDASQRRAVGAVYPHPWSMNWEELQSLSLRMHNFWGLVWVHPTPRGRWEYHDTNWVLQDSMAAI